MAIALDDVYSNFREYILNNLNYELDKTFKLQNKEELCDDDRTSFNWFKDIKIYKSEYTSFNEKVILFNYIHVHNNRLGIKPVEEIYISLLLKEAYKILEGKSI